MADETQERGGEDESKQNRPTRVSGGYKEPSKRVKGKGGIDPTTIRFKTSFRNTIYDVMLSRGWKPTESEMDWDLHWAERDWMFEVFDHAHLEHWQRVNHYRNDRELCRKDLLIKNVKRHKRQLERQKNFEEASKFSFCPTTFVLPGEYALFVETFKKSSNTTWIMKPIGRSQGKGIFLFRNLSQISKWRSENRWKAENTDVEAYVVQRYISNPFLVGGKKFDMRIYALVTSFSPLTVYLHRGGFARFSNSKYSSNVSDMSNQYVHLTNVAVQKSAENYNSSTGGKWDVRDLKLYLMARFGAQVTDKLFTDIKDIILNSLRCVQKVMINDKHCFELYGYDIMFDADLRPWLIEVNASPSLAANTRDDYNMKFAMLNDVLDIVDMEKKLTGEETQVGGFDLICKGDQEVTSKQNLIYSTHLGCDIPIGKHKQPSTPTLPLHGQQGSSSSSKPSQVQPCTDTRAECKT